MKSWTTAFIFIAVLISNISKGQTPDTLARLNDPEVFVLQTELYYTDHHGYDHYEYNCYLQIKTGERTDTIQLPFTITDEEDSCTLEAKQMNGKGSPEITVRYPYYTRLIWRSNLVAHHLLCETSWDIDSKKRLSDILVLGESQSSGVKAITTNLVGDHTLKSYGYLLVTNKGKTDTIAFDEFEYDNSTFSDFTIETRQLNRKGQPEILITYTRSFANEGSAGGAAESTITQVWNIDAKEKMFEATNHNSYAGCARYSDEPCWVCDYTYEITFTPNGQILVDNLTIRAENDPCPVDKKQGTYSLVNGVFILTKEK